MNPMALAKKAKRTLVKTAKTDAKKVLGMKSKLKIAHSYQIHQREIHDSLAFLPQPELTEAEKREIDRYWAQFGYKFTDYSWFRWYYGTLGVRDPRYIPHNIYFTMVLPHYNKQAFVGAYKDKNAFERILNDSSIFPKTILKRINGDFYAPDGTYLSNTAGDPAVRRLIMEHSSVILKNVLDSGQGKNVKKYEIGGEADVDRLLADWEPVKDYLIQEVVQQHPFFAQFNESSVNIMRINSWYKDGEVYISTPVLRFGMPGFATDVCHIDGEEIVRLVGITDDGKLHGDVVHMNGTHWPLTEIVKDPIMEVPAWDKITAMIRENAKKLPYFRLIGWDITVDVNENPLVIEYNIKLPSPYSSQMTDGPMWGDKTDELLSFLKDPKAQKKYYMPNHRTK